MDAINVYSGDKILATATLRDGFDFKIHDKKAYIYFDDNMTLEKFERFLANRVFPDRKDSSTRDALDELGIPYYDVKKILWKTNGRMIHDDVWVEMV